jgi:MFS transporter, DHA1 family, multidrug resistance protein
MNDTSKITLNKFFLALLAALPSIYAVLFTPSLPFLADYFNVAFSQSQLPMSAFLLGYAFGQLPYGPLSNRFGRKPILCLGIAIAIASCFLCILAGYLKNFPLFILARFLMAMGSCAGLNIAFTIVGDIYSKIQALKIFSFIMLFSAIIPGSATCIGGVIMEHLGWQSCFYFLILFGTVLLIVSHCVLPETLLKADPSALQWKAILKDYAKECKNTQLVLSAVMTGCGVSMIYLFASAAPFIGINLIGMNPDQYGTWAFFPSLGLAVGSLFTERISSRMTPKQLLWLGSKILLIASLLSLSAFYFGHINPWSLFFPMLCIDTGLAFIFATTAAIALTGAKNKSIGSSLMHFINLGITVISVYLIGITSIKNPVMLPLLFLLLVLVISFLMRKLVANLKEEPSAVS